MSFAVVLPPPLLAPTPELDSNISEPCTTGAALPDAPAAIGACMSRTGLPASELAATGSAGAREVTDGVAGDTKWTEADDGDETDVAAGTTAAAVAAGADTTAAVSAVRAPGKAADGETSAVGDTEIPPAATPAASAAKAMVGVGDSDTIVDTDCVVRGVVVGVPAPTAGTRVTLSLLVTNSLDSGSPPLSVAASVMFT